jgi:hypothetical protein
MVLDYNAHTKVGNKPKESMRKNVEKRIKAAQLN